MMADQQPTVVEEGADLLTAFQMSPPPIGQDVLNGGEQQGPEDSNDIGDIVMNTCLSAPLSVLNGLQLKLDGHEHLFASFTYALSPLTDKLAPVDWKLLVTEDVESQHIRCHELQTGDNLPELIAAFKKAYAVAVVLINTSEDYSMDSSFLTKKQESPLPVLLLKRSDGMTLLNKIELHKENVLAKISIESDVDPVQRPEGMQQNAGNRPAYTNPDQRASREQGYRQRFIQFVTREKHHPLVNLKEDLNKLLFPHGKLVIICEDSGTFTMALSTFCQYEKYAKPESSRTDVNDALRKMNHHLAQNFARDFPFYLVLAYTINMKPNIYQCDEYGVFIRSCIEKMESTVPRLVASTFLGFLRRCDFGVQFESENPTSVFCLLQKSCIQMARISCNTWKKKNSAAKPSQNHQNFVYSRFMWVSLYLRLHVECGTITNRTADIWYSDVINVIANLAMDSRIVAEVKEGLEFGCQINLPPNITFSPLLLADLFANERNVRPFNHLSNYINVLKPYISQEKDFFNFLTMIRAVYDTRLTNTRETIDYSALSVVGTLTGTLQEGVAFVNTLHKFWTDRKFDSQLFDAECKKWVLLLLKLVDITGDNAQFHFEIFLGKPLRTNAMKEYRDDIIKHVIQLTRISFSQLTVQQFFSLYKAFHIWPNKIVEEYLQQYKMPSGMKISDSIWKELLSEVVKRFSGAQHHYYLLNFLQSVAKHYFDNGQAGDLVVDLLKLGVPRLFAVVAERKEDQAVSREFSHFLQGYISRYSLKHIILEKMGDIMCAISDQRDEFQQLVLAVVQREVVPEFKALQGQKSMSSGPLDSVLHETITALYSDLTWMQALTTKQQLRWGIVASCCGKILITKEHLDWVHLYEFAIECLGSIYNSYCKRKKLQEDRCLLSADGLPKEIAHSPSESIKKYFDWIRQVQAVLVEWKQKFMNQQINYDEILTYANQQSQLQNVANIVCASSAIVDTHGTIAVKTLLLHTFEQLNAVLIKYIPGNPDANWCFLPSLLQDWGVALPPHLQDIILRHVLFPGQEKSGELLENYISPNTNGIFQPGHDISLKLTKAFTLHEMSVLVEGLNAFVQPIMGVLDMLVFFKLHPSKMFDKYLHVYLQKESEPEVEEQPKSAFSFTVPVIPSFNVQPQARDQTVVEGLPLQVLHKALNRTHALILKLMQGTAAYSEITAEGELNLANLDIKEEFDALHSFSAYLKPPLASHKGLVGVQSMLELFQYSHHIQIIHCVCEQYNLQRCLNDPQLVELDQLVKKLNQEKSCAKLTLNEASEKLESVKKILCLSSKKSPRCLELFTAVGDSAAFYQFVRDKWFMKEGCQAVAKEKSQVQEDLSTKVSQVQAVPKDVGDTVSWKEAQALFWQQYQLVTANLQHEEYDETVLNHLYAAFKFIGPFMDTQQSFHKLMSQVTSLDVTNGIKQLQTVNSNITLIQLWFSRAEGDTLENVAKELHCIIKTGYYIFCTPDASSNVTELMLKYTPSASQQSCPTSSLQSSQPSSLEDVEVVPPHEQTFPDVVLQQESQNTHNTLVVNVQHWNSEQISDFVRKLGFLDTEKEGGHDIKHFLHVNEVAHKLLNLTVRLRELGHPKYIKPLVNESLSCAVNIGEANQRVHETERILTKWMERVAELRNEYKWLLFFSVPKLLLLYHLLQDQNLAAIVHEISFLFSNTQASWESAVVEKSVKNFQDCIERGDAPMHVVGSFLEMVFKNYSLPKHCVGDCPQPCSASQLSSPKPTQLLHYCPRYSQAQLICQILFIYNGVPEAFEVFRCHPLSTEDQLSLFLNRITKHSLQCLILEVNQLPFKLQEYLIQLHLAIRERNSSKAPCLHFVETAPSVLRKMPWVVLREHTESVPSLNFEEARRLCIQKIAQPEDIACLQLVYGHAGDGKTHYIQQQLASSPASLTIAINEAFTPVNAISKLRSLPFSLKDCVIFFNFTMLPPGDSVDDIEQARHRRLTEVIGWFFFDLLMLGYVEDSDTGLSFHIPRGLAWAIYVEVPSHDNMTPEEALKHFQQEIPALGLLGTPHQIHSDTPYTVDDGVQLVCKYLKALQIGGKGGIDRLYQEVGSHANQPVKFSSNTDLPNEECQQLLLQHMAAHIRNSKITQRLFIKYMERRCKFLDTLPAFNFNTGAGEYLLDERNKRVRTNTRQLGSTLMKTMLKEVHDFCDPAIKENWALKPHQQLIYDFKDGGASLGLISLHPEKLPDEDTMNFKKIGVKIPSMDELYSRGLLDEYLSRALSVELENGRLTPIDDSAYVLTLDYTIKMLNIHERYQCGVPVIIEGETGVGKTALVEMLSKLWNYALLVQWNKQCSRLLDLMRRKLGDISVDVSDNYQVCIQAVEALSSGQHVPLEDLVLLGQLPDAEHGCRQFHSLLRSFLLPMKKDPVVSLLTLKESQQQETSLEELFEKAETEDSAESTASLLSGVLSTQIKPTFHKLNVHAALTPADIWKHLEPVFTQAKKLQEYFKSKLKDTSTPKVPFVTLFLDEVNTSSYVGLFKEIIIDRTFDGKPIPDNVFIVAACNPHRGNAHHGNSLLSHGGKEIWVRGTYYVRQLHPTLRFLMWDYGSMNTDQEREYINAKMEMLSKEKQTTEVAILTDLIMISQERMRHYAFLQLCSGKLDDHKAKKSSRSCVSQRDIQRVFTLYQWMMDSYTKYKPHGERQNYDRRAVLVALGIVYYMRLNSQYRKDYEEYLDGQIRLQNEVSFSQALNDELDWYIQQVELPTGIARTQALKENLFATIVCTVTHTPLIIVGAPGSSKTLSFNLAIANLKGQESKMKHFRDTTVFQSLDPHFYQCSRRTTSNEIQIVFSRAINRQRSHSKFKLPIYCVVFMDEAGLPEESHESLKVLHYHLDKQEVSFVAITNHILDAAKTNRAVSLFRPEASKEDLQTLAKGCLCTNPNNPPAELKKDLEMIVKFCPAYSHLMTKPNFSQYFGLRDFIHFVSYLRRHRDQMLTQQLVMEALERNFNGSDHFDQICNTFLSKVHSNKDQVKCRNILEVLQNSLEDRPKHKCRDMAEAEVRYKLIIDPSEDDSLVRLLFSFGVLQRKETRMFVCSDFPGDSQLQKINTIAAIRHSAIEGHTVLMTQTDDIHESFYDLFNQRFRRIDDPQEGPRYYTNIAIGAHLKPSRVDPNFQCVVVIKKSELHDTPAPFLNRFEKYCISHHSLLETALTHLPACIKIIMKAAMEKVQDFINKTSGPGNLYGLQPETLASLMLSLLPPLTHSYKPLEKSSVINDSLDLKVLLMQELLQNLRQCTGLQIPPYSVDELHLDTDCLFELVLIDPQFEGLLPNLSKSAAVQAVEEAIRVLHNSPAPQDGATQLSLKGCLVVALLQQWLVRHLCKRLMQLMTSEALTLYRNVIPSSYLENYLSFHTHFSLKELILKYQLAVEHGRQNPTICSSPTKLLCFTRSSPLIHQLPSQYLNSIFNSQAAEIAQPTLCDLVFNDPSKVVVCKLSNFISQSTMQEILKGFVQSDTAQVCLLVANMQETSLQMVNHLRIMIEEAEILSTQQAKLFVMLLHFPPAQLFDPCYPSLFLKGWDHWYLDSVGHSGGQGVVDIRDWFWQCCFSKQSLQPSEDDSLMLALKKILSEAIPVLSSHMLFGSTQGASFNQPMNGSQRSDILKDLLFEKGVGWVLCKRFRSYWKPKVMTEYLERSAMFTKDRESTLNITDSIQTKFKSLFFDFLVYMLFRINEDFNIDILFDSDCTPAVRDLFLDILRGLPLPKLSQLQTLSTSLSLSTPDHTPRFPFFTVVCEAMEKIVHEDSNVHTDLHLQEEITESIDSTSFCIHNQGTIYTKLQEAVMKRISSKMVDATKESLVLALKAMKQHFDLWQRYFDDFLIQKLRLGGIRGEAISQQILRVFFEQLHEQEAVSRVVLLHCYFHTNHLDLAKMANLLRPLNQIEQTARAVPHLLFPLGSEQESCQQLVSATTKQTQQNPLGTPEHIATFVVNTLFNVILGATYGPDVFSTEPKKITVWFETYRDVMNLSVVKQQVSAALNSEGERVVKGMEVVEARLNVMQAVFAAIQTSPTLEEDILLKGQQIFQTLLNRNFTEALELKEQCPRLAEVTSVVMEVILETSCIPSLHDYDNHSRSVQLLIEGLFAHFFSAYRCGYNSDDVQWFLKLSNEQEQWKANPLESTQHQLQPSQQSTTRTEVPPRTISMCMFKLYLGRILGSCDQHTETLSGPLMLYHHKPRSQVGNVLMAAPDLGSPGPYIPTFYQKSSSISKASCECLRMQQPLAHLYFLTLLEHLQAKKYMLSGLVCIANEITQQLEFSTTNMEETVVLWIELQAVLQVLLQELATHLNPSEPRMREVQPLAENINRLLDDVKMGGGDMQGHGMVLALHMVKQLKSYWKFSELMTKKYDSLCRWLHCLKPFHEQIDGPWEANLHLLPFMLPGAEKTELGALYLRVSRVMVNVHQNKEKVESLILIANECARSLQMKLISRKDTTNSAVNKRLHFCMMVWLCAYYDFYDKKVTSELLCNVVGGQLAPYLQEEGYIRLIQCFLDPRLMLCCPESITTTEKKIDPIYQLFVPSERQQIDQSDIDLRHSLANLVGVVMGCPTHSNHIWYHLFNPGELYETYMTGFMYNAKINLDGLLYNCGVELSPEGLFGRQDYVKHATRGTYTLHSLYLLLWANFGAFCMALLTQHKAEADIHGPIISKGLSVRHYCISQLRAVWMHMRNNLNLSDEECSFLVMACTNRLHKLMCEPYDSQVLSTGTIIPGCLRGIFKTPQELDDYEKVWHNCIYQPSWSKLKEKFAQRSQLSLKKPFNSIRHFGLCYPHFPTEQDFIHSVLTSGDIQSHTQGGDLYLLGRFAQEWPQLQAGGLLLPDLLEFYQWLHTALSHLVTKEHAATISIGRVVELAVRRYSEEEGKHIQTLYNRVKEKYNHYMELIGGAIGIKAYTALRQGTKIYTIADDKPLLNYLSVVEDDRDDCLYTAAKDIITAHNAFIEGVYSTIKDRLTHFLPEKPAKVYPSEVNDNSNCIVGNSKSLHGINDFLQLVRSHYHPSSDNVHMELQQQTSTSSSLLQTSEFQLSMLQEDIVAYFFAGKPLICILPSSLLRMPFKFHQPPNSGTQAEHAADVVGSILDMDDITEKLPETFKVPMNETLQKHLEYEFHSASYHTMLEVVIALRTTAGHLDKALMEQSSEGLEKQTVSKFMLMQYNHLSQSGKVLEEIGVRSTSASQLACLVELPLPSLFSCLQLFVSWVKDGVYDFAALPFGVKTRIPCLDLQSIQQIHLQWTGSCSSLLKWIKRISKVLKHSEAHITKTANESAHMPIRHYLQDIHKFGEEEHLLKYIPTSIFIQHYVSFRIALRKLALTVQLQAEAEVGDVAKKQWNEVVEDLWENQLPHLREEVYNEGVFVYDPLTGRYGFQEGSEFDSEEELMKDLMNEPEREDYASNGDVEEFFTDDQQPSLESSRKVEEDGVGHPTSNTRHTVETLYREDPEFQKKVHLMVKIYTDKQTLEQRAQDYTPEHVGQFLKEINLAHHVASFKEGEISGNMLLEATEEMLKEVGVTKPFERLKIKVLFQRTLQGGVVQHSLQTVLDFLKQYKLDKYCDTFKESGMDGDLLLEADDSVLKEMGVSSALDRVKIKVNYKIFVNS